MAYLRKSIGQVVQTVINSPDVGPVSRAVATFSEVSDTLRTTIIPRFADSILVLELTFFWGGANDNSISLFKFFDITNSTNVNFPTTSLGSRDACHGAARQTDYDVNDCDQMHLHTSIVAASTSLRVYTLHEESNQGDGTNTKYFFGSASDATPLGISRPIFKITEIKQ
jgi:hypothetical protein